MCPSQTYQIPASANGFGPEAEVFSSEVHYPCSIAIKEQEIANDVRIQVKRDDNSSWTDYIEGNLLVGKTIKCRLAYGGGTRKITVQVFHT